LREIKRDMESKRAMDRESEGDDPTSILKRSGNLEEIHIETIL